jgi:large subunit ribosomal protein L28
VRPEEAIVAKCELSDRTAMHGNLVSHSNRKTRTSRRVNVRSKRVFDPETGVFVRMNLSARALRTISRKGLNAVKLIRKTAGSNKSSRSKQ